MVAHILDTDETATADRARREREAAAIAAAEADIAAGHGLPWREVHAKLLAQDDEKQIRSAILRRGTSADR